MVAEGGALRDLIAAWLWFDKASGVAAPKDLDVYPSKATVERYRAEHREGESTTTCTPGPRQVELARQ